MNFAVKPKNTNDLIFFNTLKVRIRFALLYFINEIKAQIVINWFNIILIVLNVSLKFDGVFFYLKISFIDLSRLGFIYTFTSFEKKLLICSLLSNFIIIASFFIFI